MDQSNQFRTLSNELTRSRAEVAQRQNEIDAALQQARQQLALSRELLAQLQVMLDRT